MQFLLTPQTKTQMHTSLCGVAFSKIQLKPVENFALTQKLPCLVMSNRFNNF